MSDNKEKIQILEANTFGDTIKKSRMGMGLSRRELAIIIDIKENSLAKYENNKQFPSLPKLAKLAAFLSIDARLLLSLCAERPEDATTIIATDNFATGVRQMGDMFTRMVESFTQVRAEATSNGDLEDLAIIDQFFAHKGAALGKASRQFENNEPEEDSLATNSSGSKSTSPTQEKEVDDG